MMIAVAIGADPGTVYDIIDMRVASYAFGLGEAPTSPARARMVSDLEDAMPRILHRALDRSSTRP